MKGYLSTLMISTLVCLVDVVYGQQEQQYSQFNMNPYTLNPAVVGTEDFIHVQAAYRKQWVGMDASPVTAYLTAHTTVNKKYNGYGHDRHHMTRSWSGLGGYFYYDQTGPIKRNAASVSYAYNMALSKNGLRFSLGGNAGMKNYIYNPEGYLKNIHDQGDPVIMNAYSKMVFDMALGFWLYHSRFFFGASSFQLLNNDLRNYNYTWDDQLSYGSLDRHYFVMGGYKIQVNHEVYLVPSLLVKAASPAPVSFDVNCKMVYRDQFWTGVAYRRGDSFSVFAGMLVNEKLELSYAYDIITSNLRYSSKGSHEIVIGYRFAHKKKGLCPDMFW